MCKFKPLEWYSHNAVDDLKGISAKPYGLEWEYSILILKNGDIHFAILNSEYMYIPGYPKIYSSITKAKEEATEHYLGSLAKLIA